MSLSTFVELLKTLVHHEDWRNLADAADSKSVAERLKGSSPLSSTKTFPGVRELVYREDLTRALAQRR